MANHYKTLRVKKKATQQEIKDSYRDLSKEYHPDKQGGDEKKFKELANAYEILSDPERRKLYDATGSTETEAETMRRTSGLVQEMFRLIVTQKGLVAMQKIDVLKEMKNNLFLGMGELDKNIKVARDSRKEIGNVLRRVKHKNKMNPISVLLRHEIKKHTETIEKSKLEKGIGERAKKMLTEYGYDFENEMKVNYRMGYGIHMMQNSTVTFTGTS